MSELPEPADTIFMEDIPVKTVSKRGRPRSAAADALSPEVLYSSEAEKAVIGCMMAQPDIVVPDVIDALLKIDFFVPAHQEIFGALRDMSNSGQAIDVISVHQWLTDRKLAKPVGSPGILAELLVGFATHLNVGTYIKIVKDKSLLRCLQSACSTIVQDIAEMPDSVASVLDRAEKAIFDVTERELTRGSQDVLTAAQCVDEFRKLRAGIVAGEVQTRIPIGLPTFDDGNGGLPKPGYICIAGEQGTGKSALMLQIIKHACFCGYPVGAFSMEMTKHHIVQRQVADIAGIDSRRLNGKIHDWEHVKVEEALAQIERWHYYINEQPNLTASDIAAGTRRFVKLGCQIVFLDNLQLTRGSGERDRVSQLTEISRAIQFLQKEYNIIFVLLAQITREAKKKGGNPLQAFDIADCSAIENDSRVMIMLEKGHGWENASAGAYPILVRTVKYNEGELGVFGVTFNKKEQRIYEGAGLVEEEASPFLKV